MKKFITLLFACVMTFTVFAVTTSDFVIDW